MGLRETAENDLGKILEDDVTGFAWPITVTDPNSVIGNLKGFSNDIADVIDPDTGLAVSGRLATVALRISSLTAAGLDIPIAISDAASKPWVIQFDDINGNPFTFKVIKSYPDRGLGLVTCALGTYKP